MKALSGRDTFLQGHDRQPEQRHMIHTGKDPQSKGGWDHDVLRVTTTRESGATTEESYTLAADGTLMASVIGPGHKPISLVFQRQ